MIEKNLKGIEVISFDVGFTLIYPHPPVGQVYAAIAAKYGYPVDAQQVHERFLRAWQQKTRDNRMPDQPHPLAAETTAFLWWQDIFRQAIGDHIPDDCLEIIFKECFYEYGRGRYWRIYDDVIPALNTLQEAFTLVVLSNWDLRLQQTLWELKLDKYLKKIYISTQIGFAKPRERAFKHILKDMGTAAETVLHIGDSLEDDFLAAQTAGLKAIHLNRNKKGDRRQNSSNNHRQISSLTELT